MDPAVRLARTLVREPAVPVLALAGIVQVVRAYPVDIMLFVGSLVLAVVLRLRPGGDRLIDTTPTPATRGVILAASGVAAAYGLGVSFVPQTTWWLDACLAVPGVVAVGVLVGAGRRPRSPVAPPEPATPRRWWAWPALGVSVALVELFSFMEQPDARTDSIDHPTLSTVVEPALSSQALRCLALGLWLLIGWWLVRRIRAWDERS
ncbi:hypothetical protein GCM10027053_30220 [Intrasporangium mesophilum]